MKNRVLLSTLPFVLLASVIIAFVTVSLTTFFSPTQIVFADDANVREMQRRLKDWGYHFGEVNGVIDQQTRESLVRFQETHGINPSGELDAPTAAAIGVRMNTQNSSDLYLLAKCIHAEARGEPYVGQVAVGAVILNRVRHPEFPNTLYGVIYQPWAFTAVHDGQIDLEPDATSYQAAQDALSGWDPSYGSIFYYNPVKATSQWIFSRETVVVIGRHVFAI